MQLHLRIGGQVGPKNFLLLRINIVPNIVEILSCISSLSSVETALHDSGGFVSILDILFS